MSDAQEDIPTEEEIASLKEELEKSEFWTAFMKEFDKAPMEILKDFQETMRETVQPKDDEQRKANGLEPRPWSEIATDLEEEAYGFLNEYLEGIRECNAEERKSQGLESRSDKELEAQQHPGLEHLFEGLQEVVMIYDDKKRKQDGLEPRSWQEFKKAFEEAVEGASKAGEDETSALIRMAALSFGDGSGSK
ncbi:MAG: hypothetical protein LQ337_000209 [Flavoplaca oasis]|nr:MAG: hypothetical protein LQ337_000209 [Flavoplaca oasis]